MPELDRALWLRLSPLLDRALDLEPPARAGLLASVRADDSELAAALERLLVEHQRVLASKFLEASPRAGAAPASMAGQTVAGYTLVRPLGMGGMGTVWLARRSDGRFEGNVAVKFVNLAVLDDLALQRFRREGTLLARLSHPNIARLFDAGVSGAGQPFLVLEYVEGTSIDRYAAERELGVAARLELFLQVADAVAHAHANLVVHRDLKPSNVLVDRFGQVKLLDFGIAALLDDDAVRGPSALTLAAGRALTPEHAAPEQIAGGVVTSATDVYALGVLLYQLLSGRHPTPSDAATYAAMLRAVIEREPRRLSDVARQLDAGDVEGQRILKERISTRDRLTRAYRGDLDTILAKALKKDQAARYQTVTALADDIRRHMRHEPISARPDSVAYRCTKFLRRNWIAASAAAAVVATLSLGLYAANRERAIAERRFLQVRQLANRVLALDTEIRALPGSTKARYEIVAMAKEYLAALRPDAEADPDLALEIGVAYSALALAQGVPTTQNLGQYDEADASLRAAERLLESVLVHTPQHRVALLELAQVAHARMILADSGQRDEEALVQARKAVERLDSLLGAGTATPAEVERASQIFSNIALAHKNARLYPDAIEYARRAMALQPAVPRADELRAQGLSIIADAMRLSGDLEGALQSIREARRVLEASAVDSGAARTSTLVNVLWREGVILGEDGQISLGRAAEAIAVLQRAFDHLEEWASKDASNAGSRVLFVATGRELGSLLRQSDPRRAVAVYDRALFRLGEVKDNARARRGEVELLAGSAYALRQLGQPREAQRRLDAAFERLRQLKLYPSDKVRLGSETDSARRALADHLAETGHLERAIETYRALYEALSAGQPLPETSLVDAANLSRLYAAMTLLHQRAGDERSASELAARRVKLWEHWGRQLPRNPFVTVQLASAR